MAKKLEEPRQLEEGYEYFPGRDLAMMDKALYEVRARAEGLPTEAAAWLAVSDAICFRHDVLPPDLVVLVTRPYKGVVVAEREGGGR